MRRKRKLACSRTGYLQIAILGNIKRLMIPHRNQASSCRDAEPCFIDNPPILSLDHKRERRAETGIFRRCECKRKILTCRYIGIKNIGKSRSLHLRLIKDIHPIIGSVLGAGNRRRPMIPDPDIACSASIDDIRVIQERQHTGIGPIIPSGHLPAVQMKSVLGQVQSKIITAVTCHAEIRDVIISQIESIHDAAGVSMAGILSFGVELHICTQSGIILSPDILYAVLHFGKRIRISLKESTLHILRHIKDKCGILKITRTRAQAGRRKRAFIFLAASHVRAII